MNKDEMRILEAILDAVSTRFGLNDASKNARFQVPLPNDEKDHMWVLQFGQSRTLELHISKMI